MFSFVCKILFVMIFAAVCSFAELAKDNVVNVNRGNSDVFAPYIEMAKRTFPEVKKKYLAGVYQKENRQLQVQVQLSDKQGHNELPFVGVTKCQGDLFEGIITNEIRKLQGYARGDRISFKQQDIKNWVVLDEKGNEEGNYVGKAVDAYHYEKVGVFFEVVYSKGEFKLKYLYSLVGQDVNVDGILSAEVIDQAKKLLVDGFKKRIGEGTTYEENKPFYTYHVYDFINQKFVD